MLNKPVGDEWNEADHPRGQPKISIQSDTNIKDLDSLINHLQFIRGAAGKNMPLNISVLQETHNNAFGTFYEDRELCGYISVQHVDGVDVVELCV